VPKTLAERGFKRVLIRGHYRYHDGAKLVSAAVVDAERAKIATAAKREARAAERAAEAKRAARAAQRTGGVSPKGVKPRGRPAEPARPPVRAAAKKPTAKPGRPAAERAKKPSPKREAERKLKAAGVVGWRVVRTESRTQKMRRARAAAIAEQEEEDRIAVERGNLEEAQAQARRLRDLDERQIKRARKKGFHVVPAPRVTAQDLLEFVKIRGAFTQYRYRAGAVVNGRKVGGQIAKVENFKALPLDQQAMLRKEAFSRTAAGSLGNRLAAFQHHLLVAMRIGQTWLQCGADYLQDALRLSLV
jgi:hypothetical protein